MCERYRTRERERKSGVHKIRIGWIAKAKDKEMASEGGGMCVDGQTHRIRMKYSQIAYHTRLHAFLLDQSCFILLWAYNILVTVPHFPKITPLLIGCFLTFILIGSSVLQANWHSAHLYACAPPTLSPPPSFPSIHCFECCLSPWLEELSQFAEEQYVGLIRSRAQL